MRRTILLLTVAATTLLLASGVAFAVSRSGGPGDDILRGTDGTDALPGRDIPRDTRHVSLLI